MTEISVKMKHVSIGETTVGVVAHPSGGGFYVVLKTGDVETQFGIRTETLAVMLQLMAEQGGIPLLGGICITSPALPLREEVTE